MMSAEACIESLNLLQCAVKVRGDIQGTLLPIRGAVDNCNIPLCQVIFYLFLYIFILWCFSTNFRTFQLFSEGKHLYYVK